MFFYLFNFDLFFYVNFFKNNFLIPISCRKWWVGIVNSSWLGFFLQYFILIFFSISSFVIMLWAFSFVVFSAFHSTRYPLFCERIERISTFWRRKRNSSLTTISAIKNIHFCVDEFHVMMGIWPICFFHSPCTRR